MLRFFILLLVIASSLPLQAQWKLIYSSQEVGALLTKQVRPVLDTVNPIVLIEPRGKLSKFLIVRYAHAKRRLIDTHEVWGFTDSTNAIWRYYDGDLCRLINYNGSWAEYAIYRTYFRQRSNPIVYYEPGYSRTLDGKVEVTWRKAMEDVPPKFILKPGSK